MGILAQMMLNPQIKGIADNYYGMRTKVSDINIWRNPSNRPRTNRFAVVAP